jgi:hypothetical protein
MKMNKYKVNVCRITYSFLDIEVEAINQNEAKRWALDNAGNYEFPLEHTAEYEVSGASKIQ